MTEGQAYDFLVLDQVILQDGKVYFLLSDPNGVKHFLEADPYRSFQIALNDKITCLVSKINCTGRIFLEPLHPQLQTEKKYACKIIQIENQNGKTFFTLEISGVGILKSSINLFTELDLKPGDSIEACITNFKKGIPEFDVLRIN